MKKLGFVIAGTSILTMSAIAAVASLVNTMAIHSLIYGCECDCDDDVETEDDFIHEEFDPAD